MKNSILKPGTKVRFIYDGESAWCKDSKKPPYLTIDYGGEEDSAYTVKEKSLQGYIYQRDWLEPIELKPLTLEEFLAEE